MRMPWRRDIQRAYPPRVGPTVNLRDPALAGYLGYAANEAGISINENTALASTAVYRCVSIIASTIAGLPLKTYRDVDGVRETVKSVWDDPGVDMFTRYELVHVCMVHLCLHGNAFLLHVYNSGGQLVGFFPVHPLAVTVRYDRDGGQRIFSVTLDGETNEYDETEMTQVMLFSLDGLTGTSPIRLSREAIGTTLAGDRAAGNMFSSGLMIGGIVTPEDTTSEEDGQIIKAGLEAKMTGAHNAGALAFVNRSLKISPWSMTADDAQFIESRTHQTTEVARIFGVPKVLLAEDGASTWGSGIAELLSAFAKFTLRGFTTPFEQRATMLTRGQSFTEFEYAALLQGTPEQEIALLNTQVETGLLTLDEARAIRNLPPLVTGPEPDPEVTQAFALAQAAPSLVQNPGLPALVDQLRVLAGKAPLGAAVPPPEPEGQAPAEPIEGPV